MDLTGFLSPTTTSSRSFFPRTVAIGCLSLVPSSSPSKPQACKEREQRRETIGARVEEEEKQWFSSYLGDAGNNKEDNSFLVNSMSQNSFLVTFLQKLFFSHQK
ncbi:hypothetical protein Dimus_039360 [Dionaea muscipula]